MHTRKKSIQLWPFLLIGIIVIIVIVFVFFREGPNEPEIPSASLDAFAQCITDNNVKIYGSYTCSACLATKKLFGDSFKYVTEIECHPRGPNPQAELCQERGISKTPTWLMEKDGEEIKRLEGFQVMENLAEFSGCQY